MYGRPIADDVHVARLRAQLLSGPPARDALAVAERLLAIQGQDPRGARLAVRARSRGLSAADVDRALTEDRSLVITWLNRGTLHLVRSEDLPWLHALTAPTQMTQNARRLEQEGVSPEVAERGVAVAVRALADEGPLARAALAERLAAAGVRAEAQGLLHVLRLAALRGLVVRGPVQGSQHAYALVEDWLGMRLEPARADRDTALAELARRYLAGHGPATDRDLARWAGLPLRDARAGLAAIARELDQRDDGLVDLARRPGRGRSDRATRSGPADLPPPRLLGSFEPLLLGWVSRDEVAGVHHDLIAVGGIFRGFALVDGRAVATWSLGRDGVELEPFAALDPGVASALADDGVDVMRFLGRVVSA